MLRESESQIDSISRVLRGYPHEEPPHRIGELSWLAFAPKCPGKVQTSHGNREELNILEYGAALGPLRGGRGNKVKS